MKLYSYGVLLIIILALMGGVIAWFGDWLGSKVGKKRISFLGLRPRHTSTVFTIFAGMVAVVLSLTIMASFSSDVRTALFGVEALKQQINSLDEEVAIRNSELSSSKDKLDIIGQQYYTAKQSLQATREEMNQALVQRDEAKRELIVADRQLQGYQQKIFTADSTISELTKTQQVLSSDIDRLNKFNDQLKLGFDKLKTGTVIYRAGEILLSEVVVGRADRQAAKRTMDKIMATVNANILEELKIKDNSLQIVWANTEQFRDAIDKIGSGSGSYVVRIYALGNVVYGEPIIAGVVIYNNHLVYKSGEIVYTQSVYISEDNAPESVLAAFFPKVNAAAVASGILADPVTGKVGALNGEDYYKVINSLRSFYGTATISAIAARDAYTSGPLEIEIKISR